MKTMPGFTLIELMTVIAIIAITTAIAVPNLFGWRVDREFTIAMQRTVSTLNSARIHAAKENAYAVILFDVDKKQFRSFVDISRNGMWDPDKDRHIDFYEIPPTVHISHCNFPAFGNTPGTYRFRYNPQGVPAGPGRIELTSRAGRSAQVVVAPSGRIRTEHRGRP